jgi:hypothetical protein
VDSSTSQLPGSKMLLVAPMLVRRDQDVVAFVFRHIK